jgi:hypothetical protein
VSFRWKISETELETSIQGARCVQHFLLEWDVKGLRPDPHHVHHLPLPPLRHHHRVKGEGLGENSEVLHEVLQVDRDRDPDTETEDQHRDQYRDQHRVVLEALRQQVEGQIIVAQGVMRIIGNIGREGEVPHLCERGVVQEEEYLDREEVQEKKDYKNLFLQGVLRNF